MTVHASPRTQRRMLGLAAVMVLAGGAIGVGAAPVRAESAAAAADMSGFLVQVSGVPVALQVDERDTDEGTKTRLRQRALAEALPIERAVIALGGSVRGRYVDAVRVLAVSLPRAQVPALERVPGVVRVEPIQVHRGQAGLLHRSAVRAAESVAAPRIFASSPAPWARLGLTGRGIRIAILDTGIDYTHADFGGAGTTEAFAGNDGRVIEPGTFPTAKVVGGYDFVGDAYDADSADPAARIPTPDPDPLDCQGHGTHVAGSAAGFGVTADGATFRGPRDATSIAALAIAPGTAPDALLMAYRVFGCTGDNDSQVVVASIDRAVADGADVINMSMGRDFGRADNIEALAGDNAVKAGVVVVAAAGNAGPEPYLVDAPSSGTRVLSVAAVDPVISEPGGMIDTDVNSDPILLRLANDATLPVSGPIRVLRDASGGIALGCAADDYARTAGMVVVVARGVCPRVDRPTFAQAAGAVAVILVNDSAVGRPPTEGAIPNVSIPFLGARKADAGRLIDLDGQVHPIQPARVPNETARQPTTFTSAGPRTGDAAVKPNLAAPGASIVSAASGKGADAVTLSGTSMSSPFVAGVAAVVRQAHPKWTSEQISAALAGTASVSHALLAAPDRRLVGTGVVDPLAAIHTPLVILGPAGAYGVSFGVQERTSARTSDSAPVATRIVRVWNPTAQRQSVHLVVRPNGPRRATFTVSTSDLELAPGQQRSVRITMVPLDGLPADDPSVPSAQVSDVPLAQATLVATVQGAVVSRVLIQGLILDRAGLAAQQRPDGVVAVANRGLVPGISRSFTWMLADDREPASAADLRAIGVRSDPAADATERIITFAINQFDRFSNPARNRYTIHIDANADGQWDHAVLGVDEEFFATGNDVTASSNGVLVARAVDLSAPPGNDTDPLVSVDGEVTAPLNGSTILLSVPAAAIGISSDRPSGRIEVTSESFNDPTPGLDATGSVTVNLWNPGDNGAASPLPPGHSILIDPTVAGIRGNGGLGTMLVVLENPAGPDQARLLPALAP